MAEKHLRTADLRGMPQAELQAHLEKLQQECWQQRVKVTEGAAVQTHRLREARREIARILTVLRELQVGARATQGVKL